MSDERGRSVVGTLLVVWAVTFAASFLIPFFIPPTGEGFTRGWNRVAWWFWIQAGAGAVGVAAAVVAGRDRRVSARVRLASQLVLAVTLVVAMFIAFLVIGAADSNR